MLKPKPAFAFGRDARYVIPGGLGGIGRRMARWMAARGARYLILLSRSGLHSDSAKVVKYLWKSLRAMYYMWRPLPAM